MKFAQRTKMFAQMTQRPTGERECVCNGRLVRARMSKPCFVLRRVLIIEAPFDIGKKREGEEGYFLAFSHRKGFVSRVLLYFCLL